MFLEGRELDSEVQRGDNRCSRLKCSKRITSPLLLSCRKSPRDCPQFIFVLVLLLRSLPLHMFAWRQFRLGREDEVPGRLSNTWENDVLPKSG